MASVTNEGALQHRGFDTTRTFVRVLDERPDGFVEFRFSIGEPSLYVEMFLPRAAFDEFCSLNHVEILDRDDPAGAVGHGDGDADPDDPYADSAAWNWSMHDARQYSVVRDEPHD